MTLSRLARIVRRRVTSVVLSSRLDRELDRELQLHLDALVEEKIAEGLTPEAARLDARRALGNLAVLREACRDQRGVNWWHDLWQDVRYGCRMLAASPVFTFVTLVSLALGIGANAAVLGLMVSIRQDGVIAPDAERLVVLRGVSQDNASGFRGVSAADYVAWKQGSRTLESLELWISGPRDLGLEDDTPAERTTGQSVTAGYFGLLAIEPLIGRVFTPEEARAGARVVVLSYGFWQRRYGGAHDILNRSIPLDGGGSTVIGVLPEHHTYQNARVEFWTPMHIRPVTPPGGARLFGAVGRLKRGVTLSQAQSDLAAISARLAVERPAHNAGWSVEVQSLRDHLYGWTREPLINVQAAVSLVLVMACANIAALLLARGTVRRREIALRVILGAGRSRLVRQLLTESLVLSLAGGALGLFVAWGALHGLAAMVPPIGMPSIGPVRVDLRVLSLTAAFSVGTGILFGLAPAFVVSRLSPGVPLHDPGTLTVARRGSVMRTGLVTSQIALALMLLTGFGLLANSFLRLTHRDLNFDPAGLLMFEVRTAAPQKVLGQHSGFPYFEMLNVPAQTMTRIHERLKAIPGAESVAGISFPPVDSLILPVMDVRVERKGSDGNRPSLRAAYFLVTPGFFDTLGTAVVSGRDVTVADTASRPWVAIINEAAARQFWPGEDPIGRRLTLDVVPEEQPREVIGVVRDIPTRHAQLEPQPVIYASYVQQPSRYRGPYGGMFGQMTFVVRHAGEPLELVPAIRKAVAEIESRPISSIMTAEARQAIGTARTRYNLFLLGVLACVGSLLAAVGVYGLLSYAVSLRTREIGIRKALGAGPNAVLIFLARQVFLVVLAGIAIGWVGALASTRLLASQLWGIAPTDPWTFGAVSLLLFSLALLACVGPARRAIAVDPTIALRSE